MPALQCLEHAGGNRGVVRPSAAAHRYAPLASSSPVRSLSEIEARETPRQPTGLDEFDRVLGGGLVAGAVVLIGGDPGIGKSTLLLQALASLSETTSVLYVTGEESAEQVALRARRLGLATGNVNLLAEIRLEAIQAAVSEQKPTVAVIDSIQTLYSGELTAAPGSVSQVRECAAQLTRLAKQTGIAIVMIGHVTRTARWPGRACWSTSSTRCCTSRATRIPRTGWCARSRTASARSTSWACSP